MFVFFKFIGALCLIISLLIVSFIIADLIVQFIKDKKNKRKE